MGTRLFDDFGPRLIFSANGYSTVPTLRFLDLLSFTAQNGAFPLCILHSLELGNQRGLRRPIRKLPLYVQRLHRTPPQLRRHRGIFRGAGAATRLGAALHGRRQGDGPRDPVQSEEHRGVPAGGGGEPGGAGGELHAGLGGGLTGHRGAHHGPRGGFRHRNRGRGCGGDQHRQGGGRLHLKVGLTQNLKKKLYSVSEPSRPYPTPLFS